MLSIYNADNHKAAHVESCLKKMKTYALQIFLYIFKLIDVAVLLLIIKRLYII